MAIEEVGLSNEAQNDVLILDPGDKQIETAGLWDSAVRSPSPKLPKIFEAVDTESGTMLKIDNFIHVNCAFPGRTDFVLTGVYVVPHSNLRNILWSKLKHFAASISKSWVALGDYNDILSPDEHIRGSGCSLKRIQWFNDRLSECGLSDLGFKGLKYTWKGPRTTGFAKLFERLDHGLANVDFLAALNSAYIKNILEDYRALKPTRYTYAEIKKITTQFEVKLGEGSFGTVFKGDISSKFKVEVKMLTNSKGNGEDFVTEVGTMGKIHHVNIIRLMGFCADGFRRALAYESFSNGSLQNFINSQDNRQKFIGWKKLHEIALGIAKGIEYLHQGCEQHILHFNIKPHNILLDNDFTPKICDFGLAKLCSKDQSIVSMTNARGTLGYIAPKVFSRNFGNVSHKENVYSFGMLLLELTGGRRITHDTKENAPHIYYPEWIYNSLEEREDVRIHIEEECDAKIAKSWE
ncbi:hypothetical protein K1719_043470 [Acacia pycnantha]|nr:hypothetical protein K1719_043470 [Acacia pycnantha]